MSNKDIIRRLTMMAAVVNDNATANTNFFVLEGLIISMRIKVTSLPKVYKRYPDRGCMILVFPYHDSSYRASTNDFNALLIINKRLSYKLNFLEAQQDLDDLAEEFGWGEVEVSDVPTRFKDKFEIVTNSNH